MGWGWRWTWWVYIKRAYESRRPNKKLRHAAGLEEQRRREAEEQRARHKKRQEEARQQQEILERRKKTFSYLEKQLESLSSEGLTYEVTQNFACVSVGEVVTRSKPTRFIKTDVREHGTVYNTKGVDPKRFKVLVGVQFWINEAGNLQFGLSRSSRQYRVPQELQEFFEALVNNLLKERTIVHTYRRRILGIF